MADLPIPAEALEDAGIVLGRRGAGKSNALMVLFEHELDAGHRSVMVDPKGDRWGMRMNPDGSPSRFDVPIFGGDHGDLPLEAAMGEQLGRLVAGHDLSCLIDLSRMSLGDKQKFMMGFAPELLHHNRAALTLFIEEVDQFANQDPRYQPPMLVHHIANFSTLGRQRGIVPWVASQRPAKVNATVRSMADTFVGMKVTHALDRDAYRDWFKGHSKEAAARVESEVGSLQPGEALVWVGAAEFFDKVRFPMASTYDSGRTPKHGETIEAVTLPKIDLGALEQALADYPDDTIPAEPVAALRKGGEVGRMLVERDKRIAELEADLAAARNDAGAWRAAARELVEAIESLATRARSTGPIESRAKAGAETGPEKVGAVELVSRPAAGRSAAAGAESMAPPKPPAVRKRAPAAEGPHPLAAKIVARLDAIAPARVTWQQLATMLGYKPSGGFFRAGKRDAQASGELVEEGDFVRSARPAAKGLSRKEAFALWQEILQQPAPDIMGVLEAAWVAGAADLSKAALAAELGYAETGGYFRKGLAHLRQNGVTVERNDVVRLADPLPGEAQ